jgi:hypothetical protein
MNPSRAKTFWKILFVMVFATCLASIFLDISMYWWPDIPSSPRPSEGRIYPLNNHGYYTYMNRPEYLLNRTLMGIFPLLFAAGAAIQQFVDPFDYKRKGAFTVLRRVIFASSLPSARVASAQRPRFEVSAILTPPAWLPSRPERAGFQSGGQMRCRR